MEQGPLRSLCRVVTLQALCTNTAALEKAEGHVESGHQFVRAEVERPGEVRVGRKYFGSPEVRPGSGWGGDGCAMV